MVRVAKSLPIGQIVDADTLVGDKMDGVTSKRIPLYWDGWPVDDSYYEIVLRSSAQCLPMVLFDKALAKHKAGMHCIRYLQYSLELILNKLFNKGLGSSDLLNAPLLMVPPFGQPSLTFGMPRVRQGFPSAGPTALTAAIQANKVSISTYSPLGKIVYMAPQSLATCIPSSALIAPPASCNMKDDCAICHEILNERDCVALKACNHAFHNDCIQKCFEAKHQCPVCRILIGAAPQGKSPSGTMIVSSSPSFCSGFQCSSFVISYNVPAAIQLSYHDNPGQPHSSKVVTAYLPNNKDGNDLLKRLKFSFMHGLSFTVGTSLTTGLANQCTW